jgi:molecular chaperone GrpE
MEKEKNNQEQEAQEKLEEKDLVSKDNLVKLAEEIKRLQEDLEKHKDLYLRTAAEQKNQTMRYSREIEEANKYAISSFAKELIEVMESLQQALSHRDKNESIEEVTQAMFEGIEMTLKLLTKSFEKFGITRILPMNETFNPAFHQALSMVTLPDTEDNQVIEVIQAGYLIHDRVLKPALVIVNKKQ